MHIWNPSTNWSLINSLNNSDCCHTLIQLPNAQIAASSLNVITIWSPLTKQDGPIITLKGHSAYVRGLDLSPDNKILASGSLDNNIMLWKYASESTAFKTLEGHKHSVNSVCFVSNQILASGSYDKTIKIWDVTSGIRNFAIIQI